MESLSKMADREFPGQGNAIRREFLKTSLAASAAATTVGMAAMGESAATRTESNEEHPSTIAVTGAKPLAPLRKPWKNAIAVDVPLMLLREDLQSHLAILQRDIGYRHCRTFAFLQDEMAIVARQKDGGLVFRWAQVDKALDALQRLRLRPFISLFPMPVPLASGTKTVFDLKLNVTPPRDYAEWGELVASLARHCVDRYGLDEIAQWYFEVWNEPNGPDFWAGSQKDYWKLYGVSATAIKEVSPRLRVGGPVSAQASWIAELIAHCSTEGAPLDFISTHSYPQDEWMLYPGLRSSPHKPGQYIPDVVRAVRKAVSQSAMSDLEIHWTEWDSMVPLPDGRIDWVDNPSLDEISAAATICDFATAVDGDCDTFCWLLASDVIGFGGTLQSEFSGSYGLLTLNGIPKATFNAFRFLNRLRGGQMELRHEPLAAGCGLVATAEEENLHVLLWYRDLSVYGVGAQQPWMGTLELPWAKSARPVLVQEKITAGAGSCYETWQSLGGPQNLSPIERHLLEVHAAPEAQVFHPDAGSGQVTHDFRMVPGEVVYWELRAQGEATLPTI